MGRRLSPARHMGPMVNGGPLGPAYSGLEEVEAGISLRLHPPHLEGEEVGIPFHLRPPHLRGKRREYPSVYTPRSLGVERREYPSACAPRTMGGKRREYPSVSTPVARRATLRRGGAGLTLSPRRDSSGVLRPRALAGSVTVAP